MNSASLIRLVAPSAIWGASFTCMRMVVPVLGSVVLLGAALVSGFSLRAVRAPRAVFHG